MSLAAGAKQPPIALTLQEKPYFDDLWSKADSVQEGFLTRLEAETFFRTTGLDDEDLGMIWDMVDTEKRGILGRNGFNIALRLIGHRQAGKTIIPSLLDLPGQLPRFDLAQATAELEDQQKHAQLNAQHDLADQPKSDQGMQTQQGKKMGIQLQDQQEAETQREEEPVKEAAAQKEAQDQMEQEELAKKVAAHKEALDKLEQEHLQLLRTVQEQQQQALFMSLMVDTQLYSSFGGGSPAQIAQAQQQKAATQQMYQNQITQIVASYEQQRALAMTEFRILTGVAYKPTETASPPNTGAISSEISAPGVSLSQPEPKPESEQPSITAVDSNAGKVTEPVASAQPQLQQQQYQPHQQQYPTQSQTYSVDPRTYVTKPQTYSVDPNTYVTNPQTYSVDPNTYVTKPQTYSVDPNTYVTNPQTYSVDPSTYVTNPQTYSVDPSTYVAKPQTYSTDPSTYVIKPQQDLLSTFTSVASKYLRPKQYVADPTQYFAHQQQSYSTNNEFVVRPPAPMPSQPYQYSTDPNQYVVRPQPLSPTHTQPQYQYQSPPPLHQQQYPIDPNQYVVRPQPLSPTHIQQHQYQYQSPPLQQQQPYLPQPQMYQHQPNQPTHPPPQQQQQYFPLQSSYPSPHTSQPTSPNTNGLLPYGSVQQQQQQQQQIYQADKLPDTPVSVLNVQQGPPPSLPPRSSNPQTTQPSITPVSTLTSPHPEGPRSPQSYPSPPLLANDLAASFGSLDISSSSSKSSAPTPARAPQYHYSGGP